MRRGAAAVLLVLLAACGSEEPTPTPDDRVRASLAGVELLLEVADEPEERAVGLMRRDSVPPGTGMVFLYDEPSTGRFYMYDVPVPLTAVFASEGRVVGVVDMPPCPQGTQPQDCPTYGPDAPFDTVLETAPETLAGKVAVGDSLTVQR